MSKTIDSKVVEMRFDNKQFAANVKDTISMVGELNKSLQLPGASKGLLGINGAINKINVTPLADGVQTLQAKFSALEVVAMTAISNITTSAMNAGKRIAAALTIDPIKTGFQEYETQIGAVQTILANTESKGTTLGQVNSALDELNTYADQTIYNFTEMTKNIGTFTAAGVDLDKSVTSIKGIANLAAVSGSTSQQASTAMYQLSQALAAGKVSLMDWNSVVNAGMGGEVFQNALKRTSEQLGTGAEEAIEKYGTFRESLTQGQWLTTEVLTETLTQLSGAYTEADLIAQGYTKKQAQDIVKLAETAVGAATDVKTFTQLMDTTKESIQSGWTQTWEIILGDFGEAKELFTEIGKTLGDLINGMSESRNELLSGGLSTGWKQLLGEGIANEEDYISIVQGVAKDHGIAIEDMIEDAGSFQDTLKDGWLTSDILAESIDKYAGKLNGMSSKELKAAGYTQEHVKQINALVKGVKDGSISLEEFEKKIARVSGRENIIQSVWNVFKGLGSVLKPISDAFKEIFPAPTAERLYQMTVTLQEFTSKLKLGDEASANLKSTFRGLFAVVDIVRMVFMGLGRVLKSSVAKTLFGLHGGVLEVTGGFGEMLVKLRDILKSSGIFENVFGTIATAINFVIKGLKKFFSAVKEKLDFHPFEALNSLLDKLHDKLTGFGSDASGASSGLGGAIKELGSALSGNLLDILEGVWNAIKKIADGIATAIGAIVGGITDALAGADLGKFLDALSTALLGGGILGVLNFVKKLSNPLEGIGELKDNVIEILDGVKDSLQAWQQNLQASVLLKLASAIGILAVAVLILSNIDSGKLAASLGAITVLFADLMGTMFLFGKITNLPDLAGSLAAITGIAFAILILAGALAIIGDLEPKEMVTGLVGVMGLLGSLIGALALMSTIGKKGLKVVSKNIGKIAIGLVIFAYAIKILADACKELSSLSLTEMFTGLIAVSGLIGAVIVFLNYAPLEGKAFSTCAGILLLSVALNVLAKACKTFGNMPIEKLAQGLGSIGILLAALGVLVTKTSSVGQMISFGIGLAILAGSMTIFAQVVEKLGGMRWQDLVQGLGGIAVVMFAVATSLGRMPATVLDAAAAMVIVAGAMIIMAEAMNRIGGMRWQDIAQGLIGLGGSMAILVVGLNAMTGTLAGSAALVVASIALSILGKALVNLGKMSWEDIAQSLYVLAGSLAIMGVAAYVLAPIIPLILSFSGAVALMGIGILALGAGLTMAGLGFAALAASATAGATALVAAVTIIIIGLAKLVPAIVEVIGETIVAFCDVIIAAAPAIAKAAKALVLMLVDVMVECIPQIVDGLLKMISEVLSSLTKYAPQIVEYLFNFVIGILDALAVKMPELIQKVVDLLMSVFEGVVNALKGVDFSTLIQGIIGVGLMAGLMYVLASVAALTPGAMLGVLGMGAVIAELALVLAAIGGLAQIPGLSWLINEGAGLLEDIGNAIGSFIGGIAGGIMSGVTGQFPKIGTDLANFMTNIQPFVDGASKIDASTMTGVKALADVILTLTAAEILDALTSWLTGGSSLASFAKQLVPFGEAMAAYSETVSGINPAVVTASAVAGSALVNLANKLPSTGGFWQWLAGEKDLGQFGSTLVAFGTGMKLYATSVSGIDPKVITDSATAGEALISLANKLPSTGGFWQWLAGEKDLGSFGDTLTKFGSGMSSFATSVSGINPAVIVASSIAGSALINLANKLPSTGGFWQWLAGKQDLGSFGTTLVSFGEGMSSYAESVSDINPAVVVASAIAASALVNLANQLPGIESFWDWIDSIGDSPLANFGESLVDLGEGLASFQESVAGVNPMLLGMVVSQVHRLVDLVNGMSGMDASGTSNFKTAMSNLANTGISGFVVAFNGSYGKVKTATRKLGNIAVIGFAAAIRANLGKVGPAATAMVNRFNNAVNSQKGRVVKAFNQMCANALNAIKAKNAAFSTAGQTLVLKLSAGALSKSSTFASRCKTVAASAVSGIRDKYSSFYTAGTYLGSGLVAGINAKQEAAYWAGYNLGKKGAEGVEDGEDAASPSKRAIQAGKWLGEGLVIGIQQMGKSVYNAGDALGSDAANSLSNALKTIPDLNMDAQPRITPVVDLTEVQNGVSRINSLFGGQGVSLDANIDSMLSRTSALNNSTKSNDIVAAINRLRTDISNMKTTENNFSINGAVLNDDTRINTLMLNLLNELARKGAMG